MVYTRRGWLDEALNTEYVPLERANIDLGQPGKRGVRGTSTFPLINTDLPGQLALSQTSPDIMSTTTEDQMVPGGDVLTSTSHPNLYQCGKCSQTYKRIDHLSRHVRTRRSFGTQLFLRPY